MDTHGGKVAHLRLPSVRFSGASHLNRHGERGHNNNKSSSVDANRLRLMQLDHILASEPSLVRSTKQLLHVDSATKNSSTNRHEYSERARATPGEGDPMSRSGNDPQMRHAVFAEHRLITSSNSGRVINVLQGEIAHCTSSHADILVSDGATTCHIVALWSRYIDSSLDGRQDSTVTISKSNMLATLTHIDEPGYERCARDAIDEHIKYHSIQSMQTGVGNCAEDDERASLEMGTIDISIHILGGFHDEDSNSLEITSSILQTFAAVSSDLNNNFTKRQHPRVCMTLKTCAVGSANNDGTGCPLGRGLGLEVATGNIFLAEVADDGAQGPEVTLRSVRLWAASFHSLSPRTRRELVVIHRHDSDYLWIDAFAFGYSPNAQRLLDCNDETLLRYTSTSPNVEQENFVSKVRGSLAYMNLKNSKMVFPLSQPMKFKRVGLNGWIRIIDK
jgi:protein N-terminal asparagine amidohydrolase